MRLLTIFFCGPTIVTPTFFRSLVWEGGGGRERERVGERSGGRHNQGERRYRGRDGRKKDGKCALVLEDVTPM